MVAPFRREPRASGHVIIRLGGHVAAQLAISTSAKLTTACGRTRDLLVIGAHNHEVAEAAADHRNLPTPTQPQLTVDPCLAENLSSAAGNGIPEPFGWSILEDAVGAAWPDGHQDQLDAAKDAWHTASADFRTLAGNVSPAVDLLNNQQSPEIQTSVDTCNQRKTDFNALADACQSLGDACGEYANHLDEAHRKILDELQEFLLEAAAWEVGAAILTPFTGSLSEWVGNSALAGRVAMKARRIATIIGELATKVAKLVTDAVKPLVERLKPLLERVRKWVEEAKTKLLKTGPTFKRPPEVPEDWVPRTADNGKGVVWQKPGAIKNADSMRIMDPTEKYPNGYIRYYNKNGQPVDLNGKPGSKPATHIPINPDGTYPKPQGW